jgi:EAL domain-containing protein (putative c-di-GMP-specific phosphodiesterase class I)
VSEGCVEAQGFLFGEPSPRDAIPDLIRTIETKSQSTVNK